MILKKNNVIAIYVPSKLFETKLKTDNNLYNYIYAF